MLFLFPSKITKKRQKCDIVVEFENGVDPDEVAQHEWPHLDLHYLLYLIWSSVCALRFNLTNDKLKCKVSITWTSNSWLYLSISHETGITWLSQIR